jgi:purine-cytosine permease-like protein
MMMMVTQVHMVVVMLMAPMLMIVLLAKLVAVVMVVVVVAGLREAKLVEDVDLLPNMCVVNVMILILYNESTIMRMGWANQNSPCPNSWVLLMLKSTSIGS